MHSTAIPCKEAPYTAADVQGNLNYPKIPCNSATNLHIYQKNRGFPEWLYKGMVCYGMVWFAHKYENTTLKFCAIDRPYSGKKNMPNGLY